MSAVLLTRPRAASERLASELQQHGYDSVIEPLLTIKPTRAPPPDLKNVSAVMVTSANALDALEQSQYPQDLLQHDCFCVGTRTSEKARHLGFKNVHDAGGSGAELAQLIMRTLNPSRPILHICGEDVDSAAPETLRHARYTVQGWPLYKAEPAASLSAAAINALKDGKLDAVLVFSTRTAETLKNLLVQYKLEACCSNLVALGISEAVNTALSPLPWREKIAVTEPTEEAMIKRLQESLPVARAS